MRYSYYVTTLTNNVNVSLGRGLILDKMYKKYMLYPHLESDLIRLVKINGSIMSSKDLSDYLGHYPSNKLKEWGFLVPDPCLNGKVYGRMWEVVIPDPFDPIEYVDQKRKELIEVKATCARQSRSHKIWSKQSYYYCCSSRVFLS